MSKLPQTAPKKIKAIELLAFNHDMTDKEVAVECGVSPQTLVAWKKDPEFIEAIYKSYMTEFGSELPGVLAAVVREAKSGNVQAARLVLEHSGKLVKNVNVTIESPWELFQREQKINMDATDAEIVEEVSQISIDTPLPERKIEDAEQRTIKEKANLDKAIKKEEKKKKAYNEKRKVWYQWKKRAEAVGVEPLTARRPTKGQRKAWEDEIIKRENGNKATKKTIK
tara:strand:+ start:57 stop:731 length:675 start_codon:yes stop_codon:yes gene_type:complete